VSIAGKRSVMILQRTTLRSPATLYWSWPRWPAVPQRAA